MAYTKIVFQNSPSTATPLNAENLNHMDDQIALNDQRLTEIETSYVKSFNGRKGEVVPEDGDYDIGQISPLTGAQVGQVPVVTNIGTEEDPELVFRMGAGGGGGHSIIDSEGNTMPQESAMQFADSFVSDDDANGRTIIENIKEVTLAELSQATERGMYLATDEETVPIGASSEDKVEVVADGVKTYGELFNEIFSQIDSDKITDNTKLVLEHNVLSLSWKQSTEYDFYSIVNITASNIVEMYASLRASSTYFSATNGTPSARTSQKPPNGTVIALYYGTSSTVINLKTDANYCQYDENTTVKDKLTWSTLGVLSVNDSLTIPNKTEYLMLVKDQYRYVRNSYYTLIGMGTYIIPLEGGKRALLMESSGRLTFSSTDYDSTLSITVLAK